MTRDAESPRSGRARGTSIRGTFVPCCACTTCDQSRQRCRKAVMKSRRLISPSKSKTTNLPIEKSCCARQQNRRAHVRFVPKADILRCGKNLAIHFHARLGTIGFAIQTNRDAANWSTRTARSCGSDGACTAGAAPPHIFAFTLTEARALYGAPLPAPLPALAGWY